MRFRLFELMAVVSISAFVVAGLVRADRLFECLFFSFTLFTVLIAAVFGLAKVGAARMFWLGFTASSLAYLIFAHTPDANDDIPRHDGPEITTQLLRLASNALHEDFFEDTYFSQPQPQPQSPLFFSVPPEEVNDPFESTFDSEGSTDTVERFTISLTPIVSGGQATWTDETVSFMRIGHCAWALLIGWIFGHFAQFIYERSQRDREVPTAR